MLSYLRQVEAVVTALAGSTWVVVAAIGVVEVAAGVPVAGAGVVVPGMGVAAALRGDAKLIVKLCTRPGSCLQHRAVTST